MGQGSHPVEAGHVQSLARPGGNVTGITSLTTGLGGKRLELLKEAVPDAPGLPLSTIRELRAVHAR